MFPFRCIKFYSQNWSFSLISGEVCVCVLFFFENFFQVFLVFFCVVCGWSKYLLTYRGYVVHHRPFMYVLSNNGPRRLQFRCFFFSRVQCRPDALINAKNHFLKWCFVLLFFKFCLSFHREAPSMVDEKVK